MCTCGGCKGTQEDVRLIVRVKTNPSLWQCMGQYDLRPGDSFSTQEWAMQSDQVCVVLRQPVPQHLVTDDWGSGVRSRIKLRKTMGREPTRGEVKALSDDRSITEAEIREAFDRGDEVRPRTFKGESLILKGELPPSVCTHGP